jgi:hypothetical protein
MCAPARQAEHTKTGAASCLSPSPSRATWPTTRRSGSPPSGTQITEITVLVNKRRLHGGDEWVAAPTRHVNAVTVPVIFDVTGGESVRSGVAGDAIVGSGVLS